MLSITLKNNREFSKIDRILFLSLLWFYVPILTMPWNTRW